MFAKSLKETCLGLWTAFSNIYLKESDEDWKTIARGFENKWNFSNCIGALDGKHVAMDCPKNQGSSCYSYKEFHSLILMAVCDFSYCFAFVDIGTFDRENYPPIFGQCEMGLAFENKEMTVPDPEAVNGHILSHVIVADEIFPLKARLMKPFPGRNISQERQGYNHKREHC